MKSDIENRLKKEKNHVSIIWIENRLKKEKNNVSIMGKRV